MTTSWSVMGGGDDESSPEALEQSGSGERPDNHVPVPVPIAVVLGRTDDLAVLLTTVEAYPTGFTATFAVRLRRTPSDHREVYHQVAGMSSSPQALLVGVEFADGRRASTARGRRSTAPTPGRHDAAPPVTLRTNGSSGGDRSFEQSWWISPLPPSGPLVVVVRWEAQGLAETATEVDGSLIAAAGRRSEQLWPREPDEPMTEPPPPSGSSDGWFAQ